MKDNYAFLPLSVNLSSQCNRYCSHCGNNGNMNGRLFTVEQAALLAEELKKAVESSREEKNTPTIFWSLGLTGNGELLLNPDMEKILDILFDVCPEITRMRMVTSGVDPSSPAEERRLRNILSKYRDRIDVSLSFNLFQKNFPERLTKSLDVLFDYISTVTLKICLSVDNGAPTLDTLSKTIQEHFKDRARVDPFTKNPDFMYEIWDPNQIKKLIEIFLGISIDEEEDPKIKKIIQERVANIREVSEEELWDAMYGFRMIFDSAYHLALSCGDKKITYAPQFISKRGRASQLPDRELTGSHRKCCFLFSGKKNPPSWHVGTDGYIYPTPDCPSDAEPLRLGEVGNNMRQVLYEYFHVRKILLRNIIKDCSSWSPRICEHCIRTAHILGSSMFY